MCICTHTHTHTQMEAQTNARIRVTINKCRPILKCVENSQESHDKTFMQLKFKYPYIYIYSSFSHLEHRASVKRFVSLQFLNLIHSQLDSLDGGSDRRKTFTYIEHKHRIYAVKHPCLEWNLNSRSQRSSERRHFMP
jgi:hypothetical protein